MSAAVEVCGVKWCSNQKKWNMWWNEEVKLAIRKKLMYTRWMQIRSLGAKENYKQAKKVFWLACAMTFAGLFASGIPISSQLYI